ncbi:hypothetical protein [Sphaerimonospora thailandensis]|uniref:Uncharacterized protein n=1 Tax=Sphaerimonospora thailandensis TaxID=795644 RepID=A0A8J3RCE2_9ACTN|nr:hypothetical protein [Sphaerimonospora thailandensis]GIH71244.1 hypothetical protein Mth01_34970 [Sphaerimonospora thailandensis]
MDSDEVTFSGGEARGEELFASLFDDAALFPPGNAPMAAAVPAHRRHRASWYAGFVGPFICADTRLAELPADLAISVVVTGGPAAIEGLVEGLAEGLAEGLGTLPNAVALEVSGVADPADAAAAVTALRAWMSGNRASGNRASGPDRGAAGFVEVPRGEASLPVLDVLAGTAFLAKFRTGGLQAQAFPSEAELAGAIVACADRGLPFKCTAGLHHAVRHTAPDTGFEHHGFLNVLLATSAALDGVAADEVAGVLAERDAAAVADRIRALGDDEVAAARRMFRSFGTCSIDEPLDDLAALGLITVPA